MTTVLRETNLPKLFARGKVRDTYDLGERLLMVATDRLSAFDVVLPTGIPDKGAVLTQLSAFWFERTSQIVPNHFVELLAPATEGELDGLALRDLKELFGRAMIVRKAQRIDVECVVRGYLAGSGWQEYRQDGTVCGERLPAGLRESDRLPEAIFTPARKADTGHDENVSVATVAAMIGAKLTADLRAKSLALYRFAAEYALARGIIIADTKFELGLAGDEVILIDEALTPDSSRFWAVDSYQPGRSQPSFDKQYVRDWLLATGWNKEPPGPELPPDVVERTAEKYREAFRRLTGRELARFA